MKEKTLNLKERPRIFALVYGESGTGKTHFIGTLGELGRVLVIDADQGYETIIYGKGITDSMRDNITVVSFDVFKDLDEAFKLCKFNDPTRWSRAFNTDIAQPFDWIVWDTWSEVQWFMLQELRSSNSEMKGSGLKFRKNLQIQHWGMMTDLNKLSIEQFRELGVNQVFCMQETVSKDELSGTVTGGPAIHGKLVKELPAYFNVVARTTTNMGGQHKITTQSRGIWPAKTRLGVGKEYVGATAKEVFNL